MDQSKKKYRITLDQGCISIIDSRSGDEERLPLEEVLVIGESTDQNGPYREDWHLCFCDENGWSEVPVSSENLNGFLQNLSDILKYPLTLELVNSADFKSRILWPPEIVNHSLFSYKKTWLGLKVEQSYSSVVKEYFRMLNSSKSR